MTVRIETTVIGEYGYEQALIGLGLSFGLTADTSFEDLKAEARSCKDSKIGRLAKVALKLAPKDGGHNKFLESMQVWIDINAPRYWWSEFDTYRVGTSKQSASTMHTLVKEMQRLEHSAKAQIAMSQNIIKCDTETWPIREYYMKAFEWVEPATVDSKWDAVTDFAHKVISMALIPEQTDKLLYAKRTLLEGFMQRRIVSTNYKVLRSVILQRRGHRLPHWKMFVKDILAQVEHPELLPSLEVD